MERIKCLNYYQKGLLLLMAAMILVGNFLASASAS